MLKKTAAALALSLFMGKPENVKAQPGIHSTQVIVFRHAEKENGSSADPSLSPAGKERAERIAAMLKDIPVDALYATPYRRTEQTLAPLAASRQQSIKTYNPSALQPLVEALRKEEGKTIVIAGHANTAPELVNLLTERNQYQQLSEEDFGRMWVVTLYQGKAVSCLLLNTN